MSDSTTPRAGGSIVTLVWVLVGFVAAGLLLNSCQSQNARPSGGSSGSYGSYEDRFGNFHEYYPDDEIQQRAEESPGESAEMPDYGMAYANCDEAREYGHAPVYEGEAEYAPHLDRDGDGIGCEPWYGD